MHNKCPSLVSLLAQAGHLQYAGAIGKPLQTGGVESRASHQRHDTHTHTLTHTYRERDREREKESEGHTHTLEAEKERRIDL